MECQRHSHLRTGKKQIVQNAFPTDRFVSAVETIWSQEQDGHTPRALGAVYNDSLNVAGSGRSGHKDTVTTGSKIDLSISVVHGFHNCCRIEQDHKMLRQNAKSVYDQVCFRQPYGPGFGYPDATTNHADVNIVQVVRVKGSFEILSTGHFRDGRTDNFRRWKQLRHLSLRSGRVRHFERSSPHGFQLSPKMAEDNLASVRRSLNFGEVGAGLLIS